MKKRYIPSEGIIEIQKRESLIKIDPEEKAKIHNLIHRHRRSVVDVIRTWLEGTTFVHWEE